MKWKFGLAALLTSFLMACTSAPQPVESIKPADLRSHHAPVIMQQAREMVAAFEAANWPVFVSYNHPKLIEMLDGPQGLTDVLRSSIGEMKAQGFQFESIQLDSPYQVLQADKELQCVLVQTITLFNDSLRVVSRSSLVGVSADEGKNWKFMDATGKAEEQMRKILPELSPQLELKTFGEPVVEAR